MGVSRVLPEKGRPLVEVLIQQKEKLQREHQAIIRAHGQAESL